MNWELMTGWERWCHMATTEAGLTLITLIVQILLWPLIIGWIFWDCRR